MTLESYLKDIQEIEREMISKTIINQLRVESQKWRGKGGDEAIEWWLWAACESEKVGASNDAEYFFIMARICENSKHEGIK